MLLQLKQKGELRETELFVHQHKTWRARLIIAGEQVPGLSGRWSGARKHTNPFIKPSLIPQLLHVSVFVCVWGQQGDRRPAFGAPYPNPSTPALICMSQTHLTTSSQEGSDTGEGLR